MGGWFGEQQQTAAVVHPGIIGGDFGCCIGTEAVSADHDVVSGEQFCRDRGAMGQFVDGMPQRPKMVSKRLALMGRIGLKGLVESAGGLSPRGSTERSMNLSIHSAPIR